MLRQDGITYIQFVANHLELGFLKWRQECADLQSFERLLFSAPVVRSGSCRQTALGCGFNRSMQHLSSNYRAGGVDNEAKTEKIFYTDRDDPSMGPLGEG
jgi:hypothetical protein